MFLHGAPGSRREFLVRTGAGFGALAMGALLRSDARGEQSFKPPVIDPLNPFAARKPHFAPKAKPVIVLFMIGGREKFKPMVFSAGSLATCISLALVASLPA